MRPSPVSLLLSLALLLVAGSSQAQGTGRVPRYWYDQHGNFVLIGNTLAQGCNGETPSPLTGTVGRACGSGRVDDTSPDYFWTLPSAGETAFADATVAPLEARSQARLQLPAGAKVTYARIYWAATRSNSVKRPPADRTPDQPDTTAELSFLGPLGARETQSLTADVSFSQQSSANADFQYQSSRDVTRLVQRYGPGLYRVGGVDAIDLRDTYAEFMFSAWWMVVFYELESEPMRHLKLYDGLDIVAGNTIDLQLRGFHVPTWATEAKLGVIAFDGDQPDVGDWFEFNGHQLQNTLNPGNNFFNSTRSYQPRAQGGPSTEASAVSHEGDVPRLSGQPWSMSGVDLDVVDVTMASGDTSARVRVGTDQDIFWLGGFVASISTQRPDFRDTFKTVRNLSRTDGTTRPGDRLLYTITTKNKGDDASRGTKLVDALPAQLEYVPSSLLVNDRRMTDRAGDDAATWSGNTLTVYLGRGATPTQGGELAIGESASVSFEALVVPSAQGIIENVAVVNAGGKLGADPMDTSSRPAPGMPSGPTPVPVEDPNTPPTDGGTDAGTGGSTDAGTDSGSDAGTGGSTDAGSQEEPVVIVPPDAEAADYVIAGRGCSSSGGSPLVWLVVLLFAVPLMRSRRMGAPAALVALGALSAPEAGAQGVDPASLSQAIDVQRYKPGPGATDLLGVSGARVDRHLGWHLGASLTYASNPLGFLDRRQDDFVYQVVASQATVELLGSVSFFDRFELGMALPFTYQASERGAAVTPAFAEGVSGGGVGDVRLVPKAHLLSSGEWHLGVAVPVLLPTAGGQGFRGGAGVAVQPQLVGEWVSERGPRVVANLGARLRGEQRLHNLRVGNELSYALGAQVPINERLAVQAQLVGALGLGERATEELPLEVLASVRYRLREGLLLHVGGGPGLTRGHGTPGFRLVAGIDWAQPGERPAVTRPAPVLAAPAPVLAAPAPVPTPAAPGVRQETKPRRLDIQGKVHFATNEDVILDNSFALLTEVAVLLKNNPQVALMRVEGHTDDRGDDASNLDLSQRRANNVRRFLLEQGVAPERLEALGHGETMPLVTNDTEAGREKNRRVEFYILKELASSGGLQVHDGRGPGQ